VAEGTACGSKRRPSGQPGPEDTPLPVLAEDGLEAPSLDGTETFHASEVMGAVHTTSFARFPLSFSTAAL
jgi:hypothetical protein